MPLVLGSWDYCQLKRLLLSCNSLPCKIIIREMLPLSVGSKGESECNKSLTGLSPTSILIRINKNNPRPSRSWFKLNHPATGVTKRYSLLPWASSYAEALLLLSIFTYIKIIIFIALSFSSIMNLLSLVILEPSSIFYLNLILPIEIV